MRQREAGTYLARGEARLAGVGSVGHEVGDCAAEEDRQRVSTRRGIQSNNGASPSRSRRTRVDAGVVGAGVGLGRAGEVRLGLGGGVGDVVAGRVGATALEGVVETEPVADLEEKMAM